MTSDIFSVIWVLSIPVFAFFIVKPIKKWPWVSNRKRAACVLVAAVVFPPSIMPDSDGKYSVASGIIVGCVMLALFAALVYGSSAAIRKLRAPRVSKPKSQKAKKISQKQANEMFITRMDDISDHMSQNSYPALMEYAVSLGLNNGPAIYEKRVTEWFDLFYKTAMEDGAIDPDEFKSLSAFLSRMVLPEAKQSEFINRMREGHDIWKVATQPLTAIVSDLALKRGEDVFVEVIGSTAYDQRMKTVATGYHGPAISIPIVKGVRYRVGAYQTKRVKQEYNHVLGVGSLTITNKRLVFISPKKSITYALSSIVNIDFASDGFTVYRASGKPVTFVYGRGKHDITTVKIARLWREAVANS